VPITGDIDKLSIDAERAAGGGFRRRPVAPSVFDDLGRRRAGHTSFPYCRRGPRADPYRDRGWKDSPEQPGERSATAEAAGRSEVAPESVSTKRAALEQARRTIR
jgi:hypothetical protein